MMEEQPRPYVRLGRFILFLFLLVLGSSWLFNGPFKNWSTFSFSFRSNNLSKIIQKDLDGTVGDYSVYIEDLTDGENYSLKGSESFPSASLYKLFLIAAVMKEIDSGKFTLDSSVSTTKSHLINVYGSVDSGYDEAPENITYTIDEALTRIGRISDNFASIMLTDKIGLDKIQQMADSIGVKNTKIKSPDLIVVEGEEPYTSTTTEDMGKFFKKLYEKEIITPEVSTKIIEILSLNQLSDRIPAGIPDSVKVAYEQSSGHSMVVHKTGELSRIRNDAGLVYLDGRPYVIALMSRDLKYEDDGIETEANISKDIYNYFLAKKGGPEGN